MIEREEYRPHQAEGEPKEESTPSAAETAQAPEAQEAALNPRIRALREARDEAERKLQEAILDLETREQSPAFQKAQELYASGLRLKSYLNDEFYVCGPKEIIKKYTYGDADLEDYEVSAYEQDNTASGDSRPDVFTSLGIRERGDRQEVVKYFSELTLEED